LRWIAGSETLSRMIQIHQLPEPWRQRIQQVICGGLVLGWAAGVAVAAADFSEKQKPAPTELASIDPSGFRSSAHHWRQIRDTNRFIQVQPNQPAYAPAQVREIVANILLFQRENGGWPKDYDMLAILTEEQKAAALATKRRADTSFDNGNLHSQVDYLARACAAANEPAWRDACVRGFDFLLAAQYANGGFPQRYPKPKDFHAHITFNDGVMIGILNVLKDAADGQPHFAWLDAVRRNKAGEAVRRGVECILKCQIRVNGALTGWCQQHDEQTFEARPARTFELASICPQETTEIVRFLLRVEAPSDDILRAVDAAVAWLRQTKLSGIRVEKAKAPLAEFERHSADFDAVVVQDAKAPPLWARHYEIESGRPIFAGRDGVKRYALAEIERERRTGTPWYGGWPLKFLEKEYSPWREKLRAGGR
jgi:PelA/Pel-15E family pectate lyase